MLLILIVTGLTNQRLPFQLGKGYAGLPVQNNVSRKSTFFLLGFDYSCFLCLTKAKENEGGGVQILV